MKFIVSSIELLKQLQILSGVINNNNTLPILDDFLFELKRNEIRITSSDLETTISTVISVTSEDSGSFAVPAKLLLDTLKTFPEIPLSIKIKEDANLFEISSEQGNYTLAFHNAEEFPIAQKLEETSEIKLSSTILNEAISKTLFATGNDELRPVMTGVFFELEEDQYNFVATDAHKLVQYSIKPETKSSTGASFILPKKPLNLLRNLLANTENQVYIRYNDTHAQFYHEKTEVICRLIDGKYPNYRAVIPDENPNVLTIDRKTFLQSLKRVSIYANKTSHQVILKLNGNELVISAEDKDFSNKAIERLNCDYQGEALQIGFSAKFLIEIISNLSASEVTFSMSEPDRPGIMVPIDGLQENESVLMLIMPVMIGN